MSNNTEWKRRKAARLAVEGKTNQEIADQLKVRLQTLAGWRHHPDFIEEMGRLYKDLDRQVYNKLFLMAIADFNRLYDQYTRGDIPPNLFKDAYNIIKLLKDKNITPQFTQEPPNHLPKEIVTLLELAPPGPTLQRGEYLSAVEMELVQRFLQADRKYVNRARWGDVQDPAKPLVISDGTEGPPAPP